LHHMVASAQRKSAKIE